MSKIKPGSCAVVQLGARMHYAVPRMFAASGLLNSLYTDYYSTKSFRAALEFMETLPGIGSSAKISRSRTAQGIPENLVVPNSGLGFAYAVARRFAKSRTVLDWLHVKAGSGISQHALRGGVGNAGLIYGFNTAAVELFESRLTRNAIKVLEQTIAPKETEWNILAREAREHPDFLQRTSDGYKPMALIDRERREWSAADIIVCGSEFVRTSIEQVGGPANKCLVVPYGVDVQGIRSRLSTMKDGASKSEQRVEETGKLKVLFCGAVGLRKGVQYLSAVADDVKDCCTFRAIGPIHVGQTARQDLQKTIDLRGSVPRAEVWSHYQWADVLFLPSCCEGSATVTYEAMSAGLPVVCSVNSGSVVTHGEQGYIFKLGEVEKMARSLRRLAEDSTELARLSKNVSELAQQYTIEKYQKRLLHQLEANL